LWTLNSLDVRVPLTRIVTSSSILLWTRQYAAFPISKQSIYENPGVFFLPFFEVVSTADVEKAGD